MEPKKYETIITPTEDKITKIVDAGSTESVTLETAIDTLTKNLSDPSSYRIEIPSTRPDFFSPAGLRALSRVSGFEINIVSTDREGERQTRVISGDELACGTQSLLPIVGQSIGLGGEVLYKLPNVRGNPILEGKTTAVAKQTPVAVVDRPWRVDLHNHPNSPDIPGDPYPSTGDLFGHAETSLIVSELGVTVYKIPDLDSITHRWPFPLWDKLKGRTVGSILSDNGAIIEISSYYHNKLAQDPDTVTMAEIKKYLCELLGVSIKILEWDKDREKIEELCAQLNSPIESPTL